MENRHKGNYARDVPPRRPLALALASPLGLSPLSLGAPRPALVLALVPRPPRLLIAAGWRGAGACWDVWIGGFSTKESVVLDMISNVTT
jgi:hypothetical protein